MFLRPLDPVADRLEPLGIDRAAAERLSQGGTLLDIAAGTTLCRLGDRGLEAFLLIAGTYTPFLLVNLHGSWGWSLFGVVWGIAVSGILFKLWFADRYPIFSTSLYLAMGWLGIIAARQVYLHVPRVGVFWLALGGLMYSFGVIFYACKRIPHHHTIWHLMVMAGSTCHFIAILYSVFLHA